jgi:hypothetical protein
MSAQIQFRRGTTQEWITSNPILAPGELGLETDTGKFKIGNGTLPWESLSYGGLVGASGPSGPTGPVSRYVATLNNSSDSSTYYITMSSGVGNVDLKNSTNLTYVGTTGVLTSPVIKVSNSQNSTSATNGALIVSGGVGVSKDINVGGQLYINSNNGTSRPGILPGSSQTLSPGIVDIGAIGGEFKSLYLSENIYANGDVQVGGTLYINTVNGQAGAGILPGVAGALLANVYNIGSSEGTFRDLYLGGSIYNAGDIKTGGNVEIDSALYLNCSDLSLEVTGGAAILPGSYDNPRPNVFDIGNSDTPFRTVYANNIRGTSLYVTNGTVEGNLTVGGIVSNLSDARLKTNIKTIENALDKTRQLRGVTFDKDGRNNLGVIAQEVQKILPQVVIEGDDQNKTLSVAYGNMVGLLIEAVKELTVELDSIKSILKSAGLN